MSSDALGPVVGIDRWRGGWVLARFDEDTVELSIAADIVEARLVTDGCAIVAIDMPMALPVSGKRDAELLLQKRLGAAGRSVFISPTRAAIEAADRAEATEINRAHDGPGISAQAWGLAGSIRELRSELPSDRDRSRWFETHPETAFAELNGGTPLDSKKSARGVAQRLELLRNIFVDTEQAIANCPPRVPIDDALDAIAAVWSARRIRDGLDLVIGPTGSDDQGFEQSVRI